MNSSTPRGASVPEMASYLVRYPKRWLVSAALVAVAIGAYAALKPNVYEASLPLMMRNEVSTDAQLPGKFRHEDEMKISEETVLEVATGHSVLAAALEQVGPPADAKLTSAWPSDETIDALRSALKVAPPKGAEFGKTEIFYLKVTDKDPRRAVALVTAICEQLKASLGEIRDSRARSIVAELEKVVAVDDADLQHDTGHLKEMEQKTGVDLIELRMVFQGTAMDGELNKSLLASQSDLRTWKTAQAANREMLNLLQAAEQDPRHLVAAPASLLEAQPTLRQLKQGLAEAQLKATALSGTVTADHPQLIVARQTEQDIKQAIFTEIGVAIRGIEADIQLTEGRIRTAEEQVAEEQARIKRLAGLRAEYSNLVDEVEHRRSELEQAKHYLAETRANLASSHSSSVISAIGMPDGVSTAVGPSRAMIALGGVVAGLLVGLGILYLTVPPRELEVATNGRFDRPAFVDGPIHAGNGAAHYAREAPHPELALAAPPHTNGDALHKPR